MNALDLAIDATVHDYPGGTNELAELMGMSRTIMNNKACPTNEHHQFHPQQLLQLQKQTGNWSITDALVGARDIWNSKHKTQDELKNIHSSMFSIAEEFGQVAHVISQAMDDSKLTERERRDCLKELDDLLGACESLKSALYREGVANHMKAVN